MDGYLAYWTPSVWLKANRTVSMPTVKMEVKKKIGGVCVEQLKCTILPKYWEFARIICREDNNKNCCKKECVDCNYNHLIEMTERHSLLRMDTDTERGDVKNIEMSPSIPTGTPRINHEKEIYPYCIVWTPLPMISWFLPFIGEFEKLALPWFLLLLLLLLYFISFFFSSYLFE